MRKRSRVKRKYVETIAWQLQPYCHFPRVLSRHKCLQPTVRSSRTWCACDFVVRLHSEHQNHVRTTNNENVLPLWHPRHRLSSRYRRHDRRPTNLHSQTTQQIHRENHHFPARRYAKPISQITLMDTKPSQSLRLDPPKHPPPRRHLRSRRFHSLHPRRPPRRQPPLGRWRAPNLY